MCVQNSHTVWYKTVPPLVYDMGGPTGEAERMCMRKQAQPWAGVAPSRPA
jgi:hypothetical protein